MITRGLDSRFEPPSGEKGYRAFFRTADILDNLALKTAFRISIVIKMNTPKQKMMDRVENEGFVIPKASWMTGNWIKTVVKMTWDTIDKMSHL